MRSPWQIFPDGGARAVRSDEHDFVGPHDLPDFSTIDLPLLDLFRRDDLDLHGRRKTLDRDTAKRLHVVAL